MALEKKLFLVCALYLAQCLCLIKIKSTTKANISQTNDPCRDTLDCYVIHFSKKHSNGVIVYKGVPVFATYLEEHRL